MVRLIQSIRVLGKKELEIHFAYEDEYEKAMRMLKLADLRKVG